MDQNYKQTLEKQGYHFIGEHSAVKTCAWTHSALRGQGTCYKGKFYGIQSHRCVQMSVAVNFCNLDCVFCWRERNNSAFGSIDDPKEIAKKAVEMQKKILSGYGGHPTTPRAQWEQANQPLHFAISLNGENTAYPKLSEFISELKKSGHSTFLVTKIEPPTQLYISLSAPNEKQFLEIDKPMFADGFQRLLKSMDVLRTLKDKTRTVIRLTVIKGMTMDEESAKQYAEIVKRAMPHFLEVKSYMYLGSSKERMEKSNMGYHEDVVEFCKTLSKYLPYKIVDESKVSRVVLMMQHDVPWRIMNFGDKPDASLLDQLLPQEDACGGCDSDAMTITPLHDQIAKSQGKLPVVQ
jgi:tRNA wybutosine-synthesizing protein 1